MSSASKRLRKQRQQEARESQVACLLVRAAFVGLAVDKAARHKYMTGGGYKRLRELVNAKEREQYGNTT